MSLIRLDVNKPKYYIMKKLLTIAIALFFCATGFAQGIDLGVKAGVNFANIRDISGDPESRTGFVFGGFVGAKLNDKLGIQADLLYSQQGAKADLGDIDLSYVNVPVVLKVFLTESFNLQVGPQFGFKVDDNFGSVFSDIVTAEDFDLTGVVGAGLDLPAGFRVEGRYNFGLTKVNEEVRIADAATVESGKNAVVTLSLGYSFL